MTRIGVVGVGHLGQHHVKHLAHISGSTLMGVFDMNMEQASRIAEKNKTRVYHSINQMAEECEAVTIAVPTPAHYDVASFFLNKGIHALVEKPLTATIEEAEKLIDLAQKRNLILQVGHIERFNPAVREMSKYVKNPAFIEVNRLGPYDPRVSHVGVVLDLMIHDLDILLSLINEPVVRLDAVGGKVISDHEDIVKATLYFKGGCRADLSASRVTLKSYRKIRVFQPDAYLSLDYSERSLKIFRRKGPVFKSLTDIEIIRPRLKKEDPLEQELIHFLQCVKTGRQPLVSGEHGRDALELAFEILKNMSLHHAPFMAGVHMAKEPEGTQR
ncbi:MAG: Inositol 2-dehydrogenase/D-chiro-inositol 3-dehydrogenase [Elusimicrobia bacterium]|nr:Inositol 2-dehydrogenase/D-chiro-inositol 3-dehydrogenase [Elusimicrobiota bacterium]